MNIILTNAKRMGQLIDDLLAFSKLGRKELSKMNLSMDEMATSTWEDLKKQNLTDPLNSRCIPSRHVC